MKEQNMEYKGNDAIRYLNNNNSEILNVVNYLNNNKGPLFSFDKLKITIHKDRGYKTIEFVGTNSIINIDKKGIISGDSGGTKDNGQLNEFFNTNRLLPNKTYKVNRVAKYKTDSEGRVIYAFADRKAMYNSPIKISSTRDTNTQKTARENNKGYNGGHIFANSTNGCNNVINQVPMLAKDNKGGDWRALEKKESEWIVAGMQVYTTRKIIYKEAGKKIIKSIKTENKVKFDTKFITDTFDASI